MTSEVPERVSITSHPTFWDVFTATLVAIPYQGWLILFHAVFPLAGIFVLVAAVMSGKGIGPREIFLALLAFMFTPLISALSVWSIRRRNKLAQGPFTYVFDAEGMRTTGSAFEQTIHWSAISRIRCTKRFLFIFVSPTRAHCIPLRFVTQPEVLNNVRAIASNRTDFK